MAEPTDSDESPALEYLRLRGFIPFRTHADALSALESLHDNTIADEFDEQLSRLHGEDAKVVLKHPPGYDATDGADNSAAIESAAPSIGLQVKTQFAADAMGLNERLLAAIANEGSIGIRRLQAGYTIPRPFDAVAPTVDTEHGVSGVMLEEGARDYVVERHGDDATKVKVIQNERAGVFTSPDEVNLEGIVAPYREFITDLLATE